MIRLSEIAKILGAEVIGRDAEIERLNLCNRPSGYQSVLSYVTSAKYLAKAEENPAVKALIVNREVYDAYRTCQNKNDAPFSFILSGSPEEDFYKAHHYLYNHTDFYDKFDFPKRIGRNARIHSSAVIEDGAIIGNNVTIDANTIIARGTVIGNNVRIGCNNTVGAEGFQVIRSGSVLLTVTHVGGCHISDGVTILNNVVISKSLFEGATFIGENVKINSLVSIDHNCRIEKNAVLTAGVCLCGSSTVHEGAWLGTNATVLNNVHVGKSALVGIGCVVIRDVPNGVTAVGNPARVLPLR